MQVADRRRMTRSLFLVLLLVTAACGSEVEPSTSNDAPPAGGETSKKDPAPAPGGETNGGETNTGEQPTGVVGPLVRLKNTSETPRWIVVDSQSTPVEFEVGQPPLQLNGYGAYWCGGPKDNHNEPFKRYAKIEPGALDTGYWRAISVTWKEECWSGKALEAGSYPTKACFYETDPTASAAVEKKCVDVTLTIPQSGETVLEF
jgi:hypothetical protein